VERQQGALQFKLASARRGLGEQGAWRPCGGNGLLPVGTVAPIQFDQQSN